LGHDSVKTTMIYTHVSNTGATGTKSPLDNLEKACDKIIEVVEQPTDAKLLEPKDFSLINLLIRVIKKLTRGSRP